MAYSATEPAGVPRSGAGRRQDANKLAAAAAGLDRYWTPRLCRRNTDHNVNGLCLRRITKDIRQSRCDLCKREEKRRDNARHRASPAYRAAHPERFRPAYKPRDPSLPPRGWLGTIPAPADWTPERAADFLLSEVD